MIWAYPSMLNQSAGVFKHAFRDFEQMLKKDNPNFNEVKFQQYIYD